MFTEAVTFARHYAKLVALLGYEPSAVDEQKLNLRAAVIHAKHGPILLASDGITLRANGEDVPAVMPGVREFVLHLAGHGVQRLEFGASPDPAALLRLARLLAEDFVVSRGPAIVAAAAESGSIVATLVPEPEPEPATEPAPEPVPAAADATTAEPVAAVDGAPTIEAAPAETVRSTPTDVEATDQFAVFRALAEGDRHSADELPRLFGALSVARTAASATPLLEQICAVAEASIRRGDGRGALAAVHGLVKSEHEVRAPDVRRAYIVSLRRVTTPALLESLVRQAVDAASPESVVTAATDVLTRVGDEGVLAVVERYVAAPTTTVREQCMRLLETLGAGASAFGRALAGRRPLVARAAAELAATLGMSDAEGALAAALGHDDAGVRRAAAEALGRLATPRAADALARALRDDDAGVRAQAALAVATAHPANAVALLSDALAAEADPQVQFACLQGLARLGSGEAVDVLARAASPDRTGFPTKGTAMRIAAVHALAPLRVPGVASALQAIANDKDRAVRAALAQATRLHGRRSTRAMPAVNG